MNIKGLTHHFAWIVFVFAAISIGLYPLIYFIADREFGLLSFKSPEVLSAISWNIGFYGHIVFGGIALLVGWVQFSKKLRNTNLKLHRFLGTIYIVAVLISGSCGIFIGVFATGGVITSMGFVSLGIIWLATTIAAYIAIRKRDLRQHQKWMIYSYSACFAAVTLRIWLPILGGFFGDFITAYRIVAWLCWIPNMAFAYLLIHKRYPVTS